MNTAHSQTPQSPPTPPNANVDSKNGITYSEADSTTAYAFNCVFESDDFSKIEKLIKEVFTSFSGHLFSKDEKLKLKIELDATELEMECKSYIGEIPEEIEKLKSIASKIKKL